MVCLLPTPGHSVCPPHPIPAPGAPAWLAEHHPYSSSGNVGEGGDLSGPGRVPKALHLALCQDAPPSTYPSQGRGSHDLGLDCWGENKGEHSVEGLGPTGCG